MFQHDTQNKLYQTNLQPVMELSANLLEAGESALKLNLEAAEELCQATFAQWQSPGPDIDPGNPLAMAPALVSRNVEHSAQLMRAYVATAVKLQTGLTRIVQSQMPAITRSLGGIWLAPWSGLALSVAEMERRSAPPAESRPKKAA